MLNWKAFYSLTFFLVGVVTTEAYAQNSKDGNTIQNPNNVEIIADGLFQPYGIALDDNNNLAVTINGSLLSIDYLGNITTIAPIAPGSPSDVLVVDSDFIVAENTTGSILRISGGGDIETIAPNVGDLIGLALQGNDLIAVDFGFGIEEPYAEGQLLRISPDGSVSIIGSKGLGGPAEVVTNNNNFWVTDFSLGRLLKVSPNGDVTEIATGLGQPLDIEFDEMDFIVTDFADGFNNPGNGRILRISQSGEVETLISGIGNPSAITIQGSDILFTDTASGRVGGIQGILEKETVSEPYSIIGLLILGVFGIQNIYKKNFSDINY